MKIFTTPSKYPATNLDYNEVFRIQKPPMCRLPGHIGGYLWNERISERVLFIHRADKEKNKGGKSGLICVIGILNEFLVFFQAGSARCIAVGGLVIKHVCYRHAVFQCKAGLPE